MMDARGCFVSINVNNVPAVAPRHLLSQIEEVSPEGAAMFEIVDAPKGDAAAIEELRRSLIDDPPGVLAASAFVWNLRHLQELAKAVRKHSPETTIVVGGPGADTYYDLYPDCVDIAATGEGEAFFADVVSRFVEHGRKGLTEAAYWGKCTDTRQDWPVDFAGRTRFVPSGYRHKHDMAYVETSRGCPFQCAFCESGSSRVCFLPLDRVKEELVFFRKRGVRLIYFVDPSFLLRFDRAMKILRLCADLGLRAEMEINLDILRDSQIRELVEARQLIISLGIQTWNEEVLDRANRRTNFEQLERNLSFLRDFRASGGEVDFYPHLILGLPGDNLESFQRSVNRTLQYRPSSIFLSHLQILPRTRYGQTADDHELVHDPDPPFLIRSAPGFGPDDLAAAHAWSDPLAAWDNTFGLDALYALADTFVRSVPDTYSLIRGASERVGLLTRTDELLHFRAGAEDELASVFVAGAEGTPAVADFLRHCRLRFMKAHQISSARADNEQPRLSANRSLFFSRTTRLTFVDHGYSPGGPCHMERLAETVACIAHGSRIWKLPSARFHQIFEGGSPSRVHEYRFSRASLDEAAVRRQVESLCEDMVKHGALTIRNEGD